MDYSTFPVQEVIAAIITVLSLIYAWWKAQQKNAIQAFYTVPTTASTVSTQSTAVASTVPIRSWTMSESTLKWILFGESKEDQECIQAQVVQAEAQGLTAYTIHYSKGYYAIEYGLIKTSGREK